MALFAMVDLFTLLLAVLELCAVWDPFST